MSIRKYDVSAFTVKLPTLTILKLYAIERGLLLFFFFDTLGFCFLSFSVLLYLFVVGEGARSSFHQSHCGLVSCGRSRLSGCTRILVTW